MTEFKGEFRFLPGFDTASANNRLMVTGDFDRDIDFVGRGQPDEIDAYKAKAGMCRKAAFAAALPACDIPREGSIAIDGWDDVTEDANQIVRNIVSGANLRDYQALGSGRDDPHAHSMGAARDGLSTVTAFLEVIPHVEVRNTLSDPNAELAKIAIQSKGFIIEWAGLQSLVDVQLAYALAAKKPTYFDHLFEGLRFNPRYFTSDGHRVRLDPQRAENLRGQTHTRHPRAEQPGLTALFGCPARRIIPKLYDRMVASAADAGLFEATYREARQNLGYED